MKRKHPLNNLDELIIEPFIIHELKKNSTNQAPLSKYYEQEDLVLGLPEEYRKEEAKNTIIIIDL